MCRATTAWQTVTRERLDRVHTNLDRQCIIMVPVCADHFSMAKVWSKLNSVRFWQVENPFPFLSPTPTWHAVCTHTQMTRTRTNCREYARTHTRVRMHGVSPENVIRDFFLSFQFIIGVDVTAHFSSWSTEGGEEKELAEEGREEE